MGQSSFALRSLPRQYCLAGAAARALLVVAAHVALFLGLVQLHPQLRRQVEPVFVSLITPAPPKSEPLPAPQPPRPKTIPRRDPLPKPLARAPLPSATIEPSAPAPSAEPLEQSADASITPRDAPAFGGESAPASPPVSVPSRSASKAPAPVTAPRFDAAYLNNPRPEYPRMARRLGEHGRVLLNVFVNSAGLAETVEVRTSSGYARLDRAAREAVQNWKFVPARRGEEAVGAWVIVPVNFVLQG
jgi:protein TonB